MRPLLLVLAACGFHGAPQLGPIDASVVIDAAALDGTAQPDAVTLADAKTSFSCLSTPMPKACFPFDGTTFDGSGNSVPLLVTAGMPFYSGGIDGAAIALDAADQLSIAATAKTLLSFPMIAIKTWVYIPALPVNPNRMGIIDNDAYRLFVQGTGRIRCAIGGNGAIRDQTTMFPIAANTWVRIACTYDGTTMKIYLDGVAQPSLMSSGSGGPVPPVTTSTEVAGNQGAATDQLVGYLDDLELFATTQITP